MASLLPIARLTMNPKMHLRQNLKNYAFCRNQITVNGRVFGTSSINCFSKLVEGEDFVAKNERLNRPLSPHLTIYKPQLTAILSITHRGTGMYLAAVLSGFSIGMMVLPGSFPHYLELVESLRFGYALIYMAKFSLAFPLAFHVANGVRHLAWDLGYGFNLGTLYKTGYIVLGASLSLAAIVSAM